MTAPEITAVLSVLPADARARAGEAAARSMAFWPRQGGVTTVGVQAATIVALEVQMIAEGGLKLLGRVR